MMQYSYLILSALVAVAASGCATVEPTPLVVQCHVDQGGISSGPALVGQNYGLSMTPIPLNSVQYASRDVSNAVAMQALFAERTKANTVKVSARLVSCLDRPVTVRVRVSFLQESQAPAEPTSAWRVLHLPPRATAVYTEFSVSQDVSHYLIEVAP